MGTIRFFEDIIKGDGNWQRVRNEMVSNLKYCRNRAEFRHAVLKIRLFYDFLKNVPLDSKEGEKTYESQFDKWKSIRQRRRNAKL